MKKIFGNKTRRTIALLLLGFIVFSFLHSELGFLDHGSDNHSTHDFCEIIKYTDAHAKILREELSGLELNKDICIHCFEKIKIQETHNYFNRTSPHQLIKQSEEFYLLNCTFLI